MTDPVDAAPQDDSSLDPATLEPDRVFDGGDLDCGSGLVLLIRENMQAVPPGGVLEMRSREATVKDDLPPWCRLVGHELLGAAPGDGFTSYFIRKGCGQAAPAENRALEADKARARDHAWRLRVRSTGPLKSTAYCRNFSFDVGQPASFEEKDRHPSAVEYLLASLAGSLSTGFATECSRAGLRVDDVEISVQGRLESPLAHLGLEDGDPGFREIAVKCYASTFDDEAAVTRAWERTVDRSPIAATLRKATALTFKLAIV